jgi:hypothetical protein
MHKHKFKVVTENTEMGRIIWYILRYNHGILWLIHGTTMEFSEMS